MKKNIIIILLIILLSIIIFSLIINKNTSTNTITIYQSSLTFNELENCKPLQAGNLQAKLTHFYLNGQYPSNITGVIENEKKDYNCVQRIQFMNTNGKSIQSLIYDYIVYDNNGNILSTNIYGAEPENLKEYKEVNNFKKYFNKTIFNSTNNQDYANRVLNSSHTIDKIIRIENNENTENIINNEFTMCMIGFKREEKKYENDFDTVHILIINPKYQETGSSEFISLPNTVFEFILSK